jgi:DNA polymerase-3 subunit delta
MIIQSLEELESDLRNAWRSVYLLMDTDEYQCTRALALIKNKAISSESADFDYSVFSAGETSTDEIIESANIYPMLSPKRLIVIHDAEKIKESAQESLTEGLKSISPRSIVVFIASELDHRKRFYKTLNEKHCVCEFPKLKGAALERWAESFVKKQGYRLSASAVKKMVELVGSDLQTLASELEKLMLYSGEEKTISNTAIESLVRASRQHGIFELIGSVGQHDRNGALRSLANLLGMGEHPLVIVTMLARHCRQILIAKDCIQQGRNSRETGALAQIPFFILEQFLRQARSTELATIQEMYLRLSAIDKHLKSSSVDGRILLESLICALV